MGAGLRLDTYPRARAAAAGVRSSRHRPRRGDAALRLLPDAVPLRRAAARGLRLRHRSAGRHPRRRGEHPRGHRVPEDAVGYRSHDERTHARRRRPLARARPAAPPSGAMNDTTWLRADPVVERMELADASWVDVVRGLV